MSATPCVGLFVGTPSAPVAVLSIKLPLASSKGKKTTGEGDSVVKSILTDINNPKLKDILEQLLLEYEIFNYKKKDDERYEFEVPIDKMYNRGNL